MKSGNKNLLIALTILAGYSVGYFSKKGFQKTYKDKVSFQQYLNRLIEFDTDENYFVTDTFFDLIEEGFSPEVAFSFIQENTTY